MTKSNSAVPQSLDNIQPKLKRLLDLRLDIKDMQKEVKELDEEVRPIIAERGKMRLDDYVFECKQQAGRKTLDKAALAEFLAEHGKDISDFEKQGAPFTVLKVEEIAGVV